MSSHHEHRSENEGPPPEEHRVQGPAPVADDVDAAATEPGEENFPKGSPTGDWQGLSSLSVWANTAIVSVFTAPAALIGTIALVFGDVSWLWALLPIPGAVAFIALMTYIDLLRLRAVRYRVTTERMEMRSGIIAKAYRSIPRERVRSVDVAAPIYVRIFGLCQVTVGTGEKVGSGASDRLRLLYVSDQQGERLRRELLFRPTPGTTPKSHGDEEQKDETELARLNPKWLAYAPATGATLGIGLGVIGSLIGVLGQMGPSTWKWIYEFLDLPSGQEISRFVLGRLLLIAPLFLLGLLVFGAVLLVAIAVETWWNYRLTREADGTVRLRRGLLTSVSLSVEGRRLNGVVLREPFVLRSVRGAEIRAVATGLSEGDEQKTAKKSRLSPQMPRARARTLGAALMREPDSALDVPLAPHPRAALRRRFTRASMVTLASLVVSAGLIRLHTLVSGVWSDVIFTIEKELLQGGVVTPAVESTPAWGWLLLSVLVAAVAFWFAVGSYRGLGHGLHPKYLVMRKGMAVRNTVCLERSSVIGWRITRSPFQRRLGLTDVSATTAAGDGMYTAVDIGLDQGLDWADRAVPGLLSQFLDRKEETGKGGKADSGSLLP